MYVVNMFDTHQAARLLNLGRHSLDHLLKLYCGVESNKQYQLADWRIRFVADEDVWMAAGSVATPEPVGHTDPRAGGDGSRTLA